MRRASTALCLATLFACSVLPVSAADIPRERYRGTHVTHTSRHYWREPLTDYVVKPGDPPASSHGYYGYYGFDIAGVPYGGLYSAVPSCVRSVRTPEGYRTYVVC